MIRLALLVVSAALIALLGWQWREWPPPAPAPLAPAVPAPAPAAAPEPIAPAEPLDSEHYASVVERPLFRPDRKPEPPPEAAPNAPAETVTTAELEALDLTAVVLTPTLLSAWVHDPSQPKPLRLRLGDDLKGWTVEQILEDGVALARDGEVYTLVLRDYSKLPASPPPAAPPVPPTPQQVPQRPARAPAGMPPPRADRRAPTPPSER
ncbi:hypothetical protein CKO12_04340 [Chromatium okenii]|nr:hypothetical protein [Chromatium okenii]